MKVGEALQIIRKRGMAKYALEDERGRVCAVGALNEAHYGDPRLYGEDASEPRLEDVGAVQAMAQQIFPSRSQCIVTFNNHPKTTQADLELVFEKTAAELGELA